MGDQFLKTFMKAAEQAAKKSTEPITNGMDESKIVAFFEAHPEVFNFAFEHFIRESKADKGQPAPSEKARQAAHVMALCLSLSTFGVWMQEEGNR